jgi:hypothetical protein
MKRRKVQGAPKVAQKFKYTQYSRSVACFGIANARACAASLRPMPMALASLSCMARIASQEGSTPLHAASSGGHSEVVDRLIAARATVDFVDKVLPPQSHCVCVPVCLRSC